MRFIVYGALKRHAIERRFTTAIEAAHGAWELMAAGVYVFDDNVGRAYSPDHFAELYRKASWGCGPHNHGNLEPGCFEFLLRKRHVQAITSCAPGHPCAWMFSQS
jgi:hypothetical protein